MGKKAVLIGINYPGTKAELKGCINDVHKMHQCLIQRYDFQDEDITILIDTNPSYTEPTGKNIRLALQNLVRSAEEGDILFVHYSGHGTRLPAETGDLDDTGFDECIVPSDMNLITDFKELVCQVPDGCQITIVSDSCHSGGLISGAKEQIGESTQSTSNQGNTNSSQFSFSGFLSNTLRDTVSDAFESRGIHLPHHQSRTLDPDYRVIEEDTYEGERSHVKSRSLPLSTLVDMLKEKTGKEDIDVGNIRPTLFNVFGQDSSPKVKKFMKVVLDKIQGGGEGGGTSELLGAIGGLAMEFFKQKLDEKDDEYVKPVSDVDIVTKEEAYAGPSGKSLPRNGILLSGCQTDQTSADASPSGNESEAYGAFSNAVQSILQECGGNLSNREIVSEARKLLKRRGFTQRPGLYCCDDYAEAPFIC